MKGRSVYKILIDTTDRYKKSVKLVEEDRLVDEKNGDIDIVTTIKEILGRNGVDFSDVEEFIANPGPGSFTGIKVGLSVANALNWAFGKKSTSKLQKPEYGHEPNIQINA